MQIIVQRKRIREIFACGIRNVVKFCLSDKESWVLESGIQLTKSGIPLTIRVRNPEPGIQDCLGFPNMGRKSASIDLKNLKYNEAESRKKVHSLQKTIYDSPQTL